MSISKIKENARVALTGKWGKGACITLAYFAFSFIVGFVIGIFGEDSLIGQLLDLANSIISVPILFGLTYSFIKLKRNEDVKAFDFLNLGFSNFGRSWKIGLREVLKVILPLILMFIAIFLLTGTAVFSAFATETGSGIEAIMALVGMVLFIVSMIWYIARSLLYSLTLYVAYDNPNMSSLEVINESERMMKGNRGKIFLLSLSFFGWMLLTVVTLGIGYLWLLPYMMIAEVCFYEHLLGKNETNNSENNVEAIREM